MKLLSILVDGDTNKLELSITERILFSTRRSCRKSHRRVFNEKRV